MGPGSFPLPRFLASAFIFHLPAISLLCLLSSYFFAFLFFYYLPIFILLLLHFSLFPVISHRPFFGPLYTTQSHLLRSLFTSVYYRDTTFAPSQFQFYLLFRCSILLISFLFFPVFQSTLLCSFCLPTLHVVILQWSRAGLRLLPHPIVLFRIFLSSYMGLIFTVFFVLVF